MFSMLKNSEICKSILHKFQICFKHVLGLSEQKLPILAVENNHNPPSNNRLIISERDMSKIDILTTNLIKRKQSKTSTTKVYYKRSCVFIHDPKQIKILLLFYFPKRPYYTCKYLQTASVQILLTQFYLPSRPSKSCYSRKQL